MSAAAGVTRPRARARSRLPAERRIAEIMRAARAVFCEKGYEQASTAEIAERAGVVEGTLYRYFETKRDLFIKVVEAFYERSFADWGRQLQGVRGTWNRLRFLVWKHLSLLHSDPDMCRLITTELRNWPEYRQTSVCELNRAYTRHTTGVVTEAIGRGEFRAGVSPRIVRDVIFGGCEHHAWAYLRGEGEFDPATAADAITDLVYRGLAVFGESKATPSREAPVELSVHRLERIADRLEGLTRERKPRRAARGSS